MATLTFEQLPEAVNKLSKRVENIERLLIEKSDLQSKNDDHLLTVEGAAEYLSLTVPTIYSKVSKGELPVMKRTKRLYFSKEELLEYLRAGRKKTNSEIEAEADEYLIRRSKKGGEL